MEIIGLIAFAILLAPFFVYLVRAMNEQDLDAERKAGLKP